MNKSFLVLFFKKERLAFQNDRRCAVALLFAIMCVVIIGLIGLAVDYGLWNETEATLTVAVNSAALNAVKTAAAADLANDSNYIAEGQNEGNQWIAVSLGAGNRAARLSNLNYSVNIPPPQNTNAIQAKAKASATVQSIFGRLFGVGSYQVNVEATASINTAPYLNIEILLDNSSSMQIAATPNDIAAMLLLTPCSVPGNATNGTAGTTYDGFTFNLIGTPYSYTAPQLTGWPPIVLPGKKPVTLIPTYPRNPNNDPSAKYGPACPNQKTANGKSIFAGTPCAFACHYDTNNNDLYGLARGTLSQPTLCSDATSLAQLSNCRITLRFDVVKQAVKNVINTMIADNTALNNLQVGIWDFNAGLTQDFPNPGGGEASGNFNAALAAVGGAASGIKPDQHVVQGAHADTDFKAAASALAGTPGAPGLLTPSGTGTTQASPRKVLFIVTDGVNDPDPSTQPFVQNVTPFDYTQCANFSNSSGLGYEVFVVYTPYYLSPHSSAFQYAAPVVTAPSGTALSPVEAALQKCASLPTSSHYIRADDQLTLENSLNNFLKTALTSPAALTH